MKSFNSTGEPVCTANLVKHLPKNNSALSLNYLAKIKVKSFRKKFFD